MAVFIGGRLLSLLLVTSRLVPDCSVVVAPVLAVRRGASVDVANGGMTLVEPIV